MNQEQLITHFDRISESVDAIPHLRRFILDLAVRGKLTPQDPNDEPASELLKQIEVEQSRSGARGDLRKKERWPPLREEGIPFAVPSAWEWVRVRQVTSDRGQTTPKEDFTYIDVTAINKEIGRVADAQVVSAREAPSRARKLVRTGDVLYSCVRPYLLNIAIVESDIVPAPIASTAFAVINGFGLVLAKYLWIALRSSFFVRCVEAKMRGQAYPAINDADFAALPLPLPPLAEQRRIVLKVNELMDVCDRLEAAQAEREKRRDTVVTASLHYLDTVDTTDGLSDHAQFCFNHFSRFVMRREHIKQLRTAIFNLSVRGLLVQQDDSDEPGANLLARIYAKKERLIRAGRIPRGKSKTKQQAKSLQIGIPATWQAAQFGDLCNMITSGSRGWAEYYADCGPKFIRAQNIRFGKLLLDDLASVNPPKNTEGTRTQVAKSDLLIVITGAGVTNPAMLDRDLGEAYVSQHVALIKPIDAELSPWLLLCLMAPMGGRATLVERAYGAGKPGLNLDNIRSLLIPIPPLAEQRRIIAKIDELMDVCERLEGQLAGGRSLSGRLLEAVLQNALRSVSDGASRAIPGLALCE